MAYLDEHGLTTFWNKIKRYVEAKVSTGGLVTPIPIHLGGTGATTKKGARKELGLGDGVKDGPLEIAYGGTGTTTLENAKAAFGVGTSSTPTFAGLRLTNPLEVRYGGTGNATNAANSVMVGNGTGALKNIASAKGAFYSTGNNAEPQFGTLPIGQGGTGLTATPSMLVNLASADADDVMKASPRPGVTGILPVANGGTGSNTAADARAALGIGTSDDLTVNSLTATTDIAARSASYNDGVHIYGAMRYNLDDQKFEYWTGSAWVTAEQAVERPATFFYAGRLVKQISSGSFTVFSNAEMRSNFNIKANANLANVSVWLWNGNYDANTATACGSMYRSSSGWCMHVTNQQTGGMEIQYLVCVPESMSTV